MPEASSLKPTAYSAFLQTKRHLPEATGFDADEFSPILYDWQKKIVRWALRRGRAALFEDCGLGKTFQQLEWARHVQSHTSGHVLIVAPLAVAEQTIDHAERLDIQLRKVARPSNDPLQITNYEKLHHFVGGDYAGVVLDESSILKSVDGKTRTLLLTEFTRIPYRLCCSATPAPNDVGEMGNHAQFLGVCNRTEMLATYFVHDDRLWRLKGHAEDKFWGWLATWALFMVHPRDLGYVQDGFDLPPLKIRQHIVAASAPAPESGFLFGMRTPGLRGRQQARAASIQSRARKAAELIGRNGSQWLVWCGLNREGRVLHEMLDGALLIEGSDAEKDKIAREQSWRRGDDRVLITKPRIFGWGLNWQHCSKVIFLGLGDSYEQYYQAIRRTWRYQQTRPVDVHIIVSDEETGVLENVKRKQREAERMQREVIDRTADLERANLEGLQRQAAAYETADAEGSSDRWKLMLGDCIQRTRELEDRSVGLSVFSPPFAALYTYTDSERDLGNSRDYPEFFAHYRHLLPELLRVTMPGRRCCTHLQQVTTKKATHGVIGWRDFRGDVIREMIAAGWVYDGEIVIDKDPQAQAIRTKSKALLFVQKNKDSSWCRPAMADYILLFRAPGENPEPIKPDVTNEEWILWARPIWYGIRESDTLHAAEAREEKDERHICPLQLGTIQRIVRLWSNSGDLVFSPFAGIGSEGYVALQLDRRFVGIELKKSYYSAAIRNLQAADTSLFAKEIANV